MPRDADSKLGATVALRLTPEQADLVRKLAHSSGQGTSSVLRRALDGAINPALSPSSWQFEPAGSAASAYDLSSGVTWRAQGSVITWTGKGEPETMTVLGTDAVTPAAEP